MLSSFSYVQAALVLRGNGELACKQVELRSAHYVDLSGTRAEVSVDGESGCHGVARAVAQVVGAHRGNGAAAEAKTRRLETRLKLIHRLCVCVIVVVVVVF